MEGLCMIAWPSLKFRNAGHLCSQSWMFLFDNEHCINGFWLVLLWSYLIVNSVVITGLSNPNTSNNSNQPFGFNLLVNIWANFNCFNFHILFQCWLYKWTFLICIPRCKRGFRSFTCALNPATYRTVVVLPLSLLICRFDLCW